MKHKELNFDKDREVKSPLGKLSSYFGQPVMVRSMCRVVFLLQDPLLATDSSSMIFAYTCHFSTNVVQRREKIFAVELFFFFFFFFLLLVLRFYFDLVVPFFFPVSSLTPYCCRRIPRVLAIGLSRASWTSSRFRIVSIAGNAAVSCRNACSTSS